MDSYKGFTSTEMELIEELMNTFCCTRQHAEDHILSYKKQLARYYRQEGNIELAEMIESQLAQADRDRLIIYIPPK